MHVFESSISWRFASFLTLCSSPGFNSCMRFRVGHTHWEPSLLFFPSLTNLLAGVLEKLGGLGGREFDSSEGFLISFIPDSKLLSPLLLLFFSFFWRVLFSLNPPCRCYSVISSRRVPSELQLWLRCGQPRFIPQMFPPVAPRRRAISSCCAPEQALIQMSPSPTPRPQPAVGSAPSKGVGGGLSQHNHRLESGWIRFYLAGDRIDLLWSGEVTPLQKRPAEQMHTHSPTPIPPFKIKHPIDQTVSGFIHCVLQKAVGYRYLYVAKL